MDIEIIKSAMPMKIPPTPQDVVNYLIMGSEGRDDFNKYNKGYWFKFDSTETDGIKGFFSELRVALNFNEQWRKILQEESRKKEHEANYQIIIAKIRDFCHELYVGPMIGKLPYFKQWAEPYGQTNN